MDNLEFYKTLAETLDVEEVKPENVLKDFAEWDSLAVLSVLALADSKYGVTIRPEEIRSVVTAADLAKLIEAKENSMAEAIAAAFTLVTGATSGIGEAVAIALSRTHDLILNGRDAGRLQAALDRCARRDRHRLWKCDLAGAADAGRDLGEFLAANRLQVRNFIHSAGVVKVAAIRQMTLADAQAIFSVNLFSAIAMTGALVRRDADSRSLRNIVMISSAASQRGEKGAALYSASKGAIDALVKSLAAELAPAVRVNAVLPGLVRTRMAEATLRSPEFQEAARRKYPLGVGEVEDVVAAVEHLISDRSRWVTGTLWMVDGGRTAV